MKIVNENKININSFKYSFKKYNNFLDIFLTILSENKDKEKNKEIKLSVLKSYIVKKEKEYQRLLKITWTIEKKNKEYTESRGLVTHSTSDIFNIVNFLLKKNKKEISRRTINLDLVKLESVELIKRVVYRMGKAKGSYAFSVQNKALWKYKKEILKSYIENNIKDFVSNKRIVSDIKDKINRISFSTQIASLNISNVLYKYKRNNISNKNSIEKSFKKNLEKIETEIKKETNNKNKNGSFFSKTKENKNLKRKKNNTQNKSIKKKKEKKEKCKKFLQSFKDYQVSKLITKHKVSMYTISSLTRYSPNETTTRNALLNLGKYIIYLKDDYDTKDIEEYFLILFKEKYHKKIWFMNPFHAKTDFYLLAGDFKDKYMNKYKKLKPSLSIEFFKKNENMHKEEIITQDTELKERLEELDNKIDISGKNFKDSTLNTFENTLQSRLAGYTSLKKASSVAFSYLDSILKQNKEKDKIL